MSNRIRTRAHRANTFFSRTVQILAACLLFVGAGTCVIPLRGQTRGTVVEATTDRDAAAGRYFALVIGIDKYPGPIPQLHTAVRDASAMADLLQQKYGFQTTLLTDADATRSRILDQIATYESQLGENDNLLIYYAGHGFQIKEAGKSFWLPVDATSPQSSNRISADDLTTEMATLKARHVLVISDSCYSGGLTRDLNSLPVINPDEAFLRKTLSMRSRNLIASGGNEPVADGGPDGHSVFAWAMLQALNGETESLFTASALFYDRVQRTVAGNSEQIPVYQPIRNSGDIGGDFVFHRLTATDAETRTRLAATAVGYDRGLAYYNSQDFARAAPIFSDSCSHNDRRSCMFLGYLYETGRGVPQDYRQAGPLYRKACDGGDALGCNNLGVMYQNGNAVAQDYGQALSLFGKACDGGNAHGCTSLGYLYETGRGVAQDRRKAGPLYRKACDGGDALGCNNLGVMYQDGDGVAQDYGQAVSLLGKACDGGSALGCTGLGYLHETGHGVPQDRQQALALYRKACDGGDATGCKNLGFSYQRGNGVAQDYGQAASLFRKACETGEAGACTPLGYAYETGQGVTQDYSQAASLYLKACDGDALGCNNLGFLYNTGHGVAQDYKQAFSLYSKACDGGNALGCTNLGGMYDDARGVARDADHADGLYEKSCKAGESLGCRFLGENLENGVGRPKSLSSARLYHQKACQLGQAASCKDAERLSAPVDAGLKR